MSIWDCHINDFYSKPSVLDWKRLLHKYFPVFCVCRLCTKQNMSLCFQYHFNIIRVYHNFEIQWNPSWKTLMDNLDTLLIEQVQTFIQDFSPELTINRKCFGPRGGFMAGSFHCKLKFTNSTLHYIPRSDRRFLLCRLHDHMLECKSLS